MGSKGTFPAVTITYYKKIAYHSSVYDKFNLNLAIFSPQTSFTVLTTEIPFKTLYLLLVCRNSYKWEHFRSMIKFNSWLH